MRQPVVTHRAGVLLAPLLAVAFATAFLGDARAAVPTSPADRAFLAWDIQIEIQQQDMGQLAERRARTKAVRDLGATLVQRHQEAQQRLTQVAAELGVPLSTTLSETHLRIQAVRGDRQFRVRQGVRAS